ncbi:Diphthamide biosynthesis protein 4 [Ceratocystis fimbriata CBS 114723]|uniref:Diphthamide biosynthesis protein 4 n=1 Tax=Ceratocystis fimbriata CBS 114723 TaxID=1035309 RepID=A0A2C5WU77_9PEZI|nr:Diphthamide biosynthesis protein 4 [Ceratocystis fimbriata CBS 114723]
MGEPTYYEILGISQSLLSSQEDISGILKRAYHRALLQNHPDKVTSSASASPSTSTPVKLFTIDEISTAYKQLSTSSLKAAYDKALLTAPTSRPQRRDSFQTAEAVDLDDLAFDTATETWSRSCRCGNDRGFSFGEQDLEDAGDSGELLVGCLDCSLWLKVHFAVVEDD